MRALEPQRLGGPEGFVLVDRLGATFSLEQGAEAVRRLEEREAQGKPVPTVDKRAA
jgi:hypothetical protein